MRLKKNMIQLARDYKPRVLLVYRRYSSSFVSYPWVLARDGKVIVDTISPVGHLINHSVWVNERIKITQFEDFLDRLCEVLREGDYDELLCIDEPSRTLVLEGADRTELAPYMPFDPDSPLQKAATNKTAFHDWCASVGLDSPISQNYATSDAVREAVSGLDYPFVLKAAESAGGKHVFIVRSPKDLEAGLGFLPSETEWILQEYLGSLAGTSIFMAREGKLYAHCSFENIVCMAGGVGPSAVCNQVESEALNALIQKVAQHVDGLTGFDWMRREDGSYVLIDPHFGRVAPTGVCAHLLGVDFGQAYYDSYQGTFSPSKYTKACSVVWMFPQILNLALSRDFRSAWRLQNPFSRGVKCFYFAKGEWRIFILQLTDYFVSQIRISIGRWRNHLTGRPLKQESTTSSGKSS
ncbi:MAG: hypothetical protein AAGC73_02840 [Verrucomicrobiota bacterium]